MSGLPRHRMEEALLDADKSATDALMIWAEYKQAVAVPPLVAVLTHCSQKLQTPHSYSAKLWIFAHKVPPLPAPLHLVAATLFNLASALVLLIACALTTRPALPATRPSTSQRWQGLGPMPEHVLARAAKSSTTHALVPLLASKMLVLAKRGFWCLVLSV